MPTRIEMHCSKYVKGSFPMNVPKTTEKLYNLLGNPIQRKSFLWQGVEDNKHPQLALELTFQHQLNRDAAKAGKYIGHKVIYAKSVDLHWPLRLASQNRDSFTRRTPLERWIEFEFERASAGVEGIILVEDSFEYIPSEVIGFMKVSGGYQPTNTLEGIDLDASEGVLKQVLQRGKFSEEVISQKRVFDQVKTHYHTYDHNKRQGPTFLEALAQVMKKVRAA